jgi:hypothetical protein
MTEAEDLRRRAERALRLARGVYDQRAAQALKDYAVTLLLRAESLEGQQQQHHIPPPSAGQQPPAQRVGRTLGDDGE